MVGDRLFGDRFLDEMWKRSNTHIKVYSHKRNVYLYTKYDAYCLQSNHSHPIRAWHLGCAVVGGGHGL